MSAAARFWRQPSRRYRNFQIVFTVLTLNFALPAISYTLCPETALAQFADLNRLFGGADALGGEAQSRLWRYLAAANVMTLGLMCALLQLNLRRWYPVLVPLVFMKGFAALTLLGGWLSASEIRLFLAGALLDSVTCAAMLHFARAAHREISARPDAELVPRPRVAE